MENVLETTEDGRAASPVGETRPRFGPWSTAGVAVFGIWLASLVSWWLFFDPKWSPLHIYPEPAGAFIFWAILAVIWMAFNLELWPTRLGQPRVGLIQVGAGVILTVAVILLLAYVWGRVDPAFSHRLPNGAGWDNGTYIVLMGFFCWSVIAVNWDHWPWADHRLEQPIRGVAELFVGFALTVLSFSVLVYPNIATWTGARSIPMHLPVTIGWFYSAIVALIFAVQFWENWPWSNLANRALRAAVSLIALLAVGTVIYFVGRAWLHVLVPASIRRLPSFSASQVAQLGVCVNSITLSWGLLVKRFVGQWPFSTRPRLNALILTVGAYLLGSLVYVGYMRWAGTQLLHEPAIKGNYGGDPLLGMDWVILVLFWYAVSFDLYGLQIRTPERGAHIQRPHPEARGLKEEYQP